MVLIFGITECIMSQISKKKKKKLQEPSNFKGYLTDFEFKKISNSNPTLNVLDYEAYFPHMFSSKHDLYLCFHYICFIPFPDRANVSGNSVSLVTLTRTNLIQTTHKHQKELYRHTQTDFL